MDVDRAAENGMPTLPVSQRIGMQTWIEIIITLARLNCRDLLPYISHALGIGNNRPIAGTRLIREWQGNPCEVLVGVDYFDYQGRRYKSLSSIAKAITGTNRNGWAFFGLVSARSTG